MEDGVDAVLEVAVLGIVVCDGVIGTLGKALEHCFLGLVSARSQQQHEQGQEDAFPHSASVMEYLKEKLSMIFGRA